MNCGARKGAGPVNLSSSIRVGAWLILLGAFVLLMQMLPALRVQLGLAWLVVIGIGALTWETGTYDMGSRR